MSGHPLTNAREDWERVLEDAEATAAEYRDAGWETLELHPGDVTPLPPAWEPNPDPDGRVGFDVLVPGDEFEQLEAAVADADFDEYEAYTGRTGEVETAVRPLSDERRVTLT